MAKKATKERELNSQVRPTKRAPVMERRDSGVGEEVPVVVDDLTLNAALVEAQGRTFGSEQEALTFFYDKLLENAEGDEAEKAHMREFLELLVETDPGLKSDLLGSVRVRK